MANVGNDTSQMNEWSNNVDLKNQDYEQLIQKLYTLVDNFASSEEFKGSLSKEFENSVLNQKQMFESYSNTLRQCTDYMKTTSTKIDSQNEQLTAQFKSGNVE